MSVPSRGLPATRPRIHVLDFIRLLAILLMLQGHTLEAFVAPSAMDWHSLRWQFWGQLRGLTAPLFLLVSGAAAALATRRDTGGRVPAGQIRRRIRTALLVLAIGYLLVFPAARVEDLRWVSSEGWRIFLQANILQLNGVTLLAVTVLMALTRTARAQALWGLALGLLILAAAPLVALLPWFAWLPEGVAAYLSYAHGSLFPLFPASAFMFLGLALGTLLTEAPEAHRLRYFRLAALGGGLLALTLSWLTGRLSWGFLPAQVAYQTGWTSTLHRLGLSLLMVSALAALTEVRPRIAEVLAPLGRKSLAVYVVHLALIYGTPWTPGLLDDAHHALRPLQGLGMIPVVGTATLALVLLWDRIRNHSEPVRTLAHAATLCILGYALFF